MTKIGLLVGREWSFPPAFIEEVNGAETRASTRSSSSSAARRMDEPVPYSVIIDRISHEVPYYRTYLKHAVLQGATVVNNPFMWSADDKFFGAALATKLGIASPKTIALPNKEYVPGIDHDESLRNLKYPLDWNCDRRLRRHALHSQGRAWRRVARCVRLPIARRSASPLQRVRPA